MEAHNSRSVLLFDMTYPEQCSPVFTPPRKAVAGKVCIAAAPPCLWSLMDKNQKLMSPVAPSVVAGIFGFPIYPGMGLKK